MKKIFTWVVRKFQKKYRVSYDNGSAFVFHIGIWAFNKNHAISKAMNEVHRKHYRASIQEYQTF